MMPRLSESAGTKMSMDTLNPSNWDLLLSRIEMGRCTPFLGAGACHGHLPDAKQLAREWAVKYSYPLDNPEDLTQVAQFLSVESGDRSMPKELIIKKFKAQVLPDFDHPGEPHGLIAQLPLPLYLTTNYDHFMFEALKARGKPATMETCEWHVPGLPQRKRRPVAAPTIERPLVYHLHGQVGSRDSMVVSEDDYLDFLVRMTRDEDLLPGYVKEAMSDTSLLFIGYRLADWNFRILFRTLAGFLERSTTKAHVSVQLPPGDSPQQQDAAKQFLSKFFRDQKVQVYWGTASQFVSELRSRWETHRAG